MPRDLTRLRRPLALGSILFATSVMGGCQGMIHYDDRHAYYGDSYDAWRVDWRRTFRWYEHDHFGHFHHTGNGYRPSPIYGFGHWYDCGPYGW
ncbi:MAG: hypothetical protein KDA28_12905 [Phycisphaerales bacterium]|nr:hypothetical protein [Phycisphaerales bacterium]